MFSSVRINGDLTHQIPAEIVKKFYKKFPHPKKNLSKFLIFMKLAALEIWHKNCHLFAVGLIYTYWLQGIINGRKF
jgi:hypothetical protein